MVWSPVPTLEARGFRVLGLGLGFRIFGGGAGVTERRIPNFGL